MTHYVGRFAPSPTGPLHAGSLLAAAASYLEARSQGGRWLLRIEDIDPPREVPGASDDIIQTLVRFGFRWDGDVVYQSQRFKHYRDRLSEVQTHAFWCHCSRRDIRAAQASMGIPNDRYPGTCRDENHKDGVLRFRLDRHAGFDDDFLGRIAPQEAADDFILWRRDDLPSYQWAVSVDDVAQGVTHVVRGADLLSTTPREIALINALGGSVPRFAHVPVVVNDEGQKLSKQTGATALAHGAERATLCAAFSALGLQIEAGSKAESLDDLWGRAVRAWSPALLSKDGKIPSF